VINWLSSTCAFYLDICSSLTVKFDCATIAFWVWLLLLNALEIGRIRLPDDALIFRINVLQFGRRDRIGPPCIDIISVTNLIDLEADF
jgi:hypothetical protein